MITDSEKEAARAELRHALAALEDGAGEETWGIGSVLERMQDRRTWQHGADRAATGRAFNALKAADHACMLLPGALTVPLIISAMNRLGPAALESILERDPGCKRCGMHPCHALCSQVLHDS